MKKWGVTKPSRQRRKKPLSRQTEDNTIQHFGPADLKRRVEETSLPQILASSLPHCGSPNLPDIWNNHKQWAFTQDQLLDSQQAETVFASSNTSPIGYSSDSSASHFSGPQPITVAQAMSEHAFGYRYPVSNSSHETSRSVGVMGTVHSGFTAPRDIPTSSKPLSNGLSIGWQSPDSTEFQAGGSQNRAPAPPISSPAILPRSPWNYPTPEVCQNSSPTIYPIEHSTMKHLNYAKDLMENDDNHSYSTLEDISLTEAEIASSLGVWNPATYVSSSQGRDSQYQMAKRTPCQRHPRDGKPQSVETALALAETHHSSKLEPPGQFCGSPILDVSLSPMSTASSPHSAFTADGVNPEYFMLGARLA